MGAGSGNQRLAGRAAELLGARHPVAAAATVSAAGVDTATAGCDASADFEIGSISKGITGLLYVDALERGAITRTTTLGDVFDLGAVPAAAVTLDSISRHRSGLPRLPRSALTVGRTVAFLRHGTNPYGETRDELIDQAAPSRWASRDRTTPTSGSSCSATRWRRPLERPTRSWFTTAWPARWG